MKTHHQLSQFRNRSLVVAGLALLVLIGFASAAAAQERESPPSRTLPVETRAPSPPPSPPPSPAPSPSPGVDAPRGTPGGGGGGGRRHGGGGYGHHPRRHYGYGYGFYGYGFHWPYHRFYWDYHYPSYPWGLVWYPAYSSDTRLGAFDLAVKPKKVEVYVDGQYVGTAGKFDGYPGYLWLTEGSHQLVFYREGYETEVRRVSVRSGPIRGLRLTLAKGQATPPDELFAAPRTAQAVKPDRSTPPAAPQRSRPTERTERAEMDLRGEPGRFRLDVEPLDASIYLDGRFLGSAEELSRLHAGMMVDAGEHFIDVQRPGYESERVRFSVDPGDETEVKVDLSSSEGPSD